LAITLKCTGCQNSFRLRDEMAGRKVRCPECEAVLVVPVAESEEVRFEADSDESEFELHPALDRDRFLLRQKLITLSEKYVVCDDQERPVLYVERPAHFWRNLGAMLATILALVLSISIAVVLGTMVSQAVGPRWIGPVLTVLLVVAGIVLSAVVGIGLSPKRHISFFPDESKEQLVLQVLQDKKFQPIVATYTVITPEGDLLGRMNKNYLYNFFRRKWDVFDAEGRIVLIGREDSLLLSMLRRLIGPMMGFLRANFILVVPQPDGSEVTCGEFNRNFTIFDRYVLDLRQDRPRMIDRRLAIALGVLLDTGEHR
jgi:DNA-directed RNA polymerase subunit RPC12/RpoP